MCTPLNETRNPASGPCGSSRCGEGPQFGPVPVHTRTWIDSGSGNKTLLLLLLRFRAKQGDVEGKRTPGPHSGMKATGTTA